MTSAVSGSDSGAIMRPLVVASLGHFIVDFMLGIWPIYKTMFHIDLVTAGLIAAFCASVGEGMQLIFGPWCDLGRRKVLLVLGVTLTATTSLLAYFEHPLILTLLLLLTYIGSAAFHPAGGSIVFSLGKGRKGLMMGIFAAGGALGLALSQIAYASLYQWTAGHMIVLALPVLLVVLWSTLQSLPEKKSDGQKRARPSAKAMLALLKIPSLRTLYIAQVLNQSFYWGLIFLLPDILYERGYETWLYAGGGHFVMVMGLALLTVPLGSYADRVGAHRVLLLCQLGALCAVYLILLQPQLSPAVLLTLLFVVGACAGSCSPVGVVLGNQIYPGSPGTVTAFLMGFVWILSEGVGQGVAGGMTGFFTVDAASKSMALIGVLLLASLALTSKVSSEQLVMEEDLAQIA